MAKKIFFIGIFLLLSVSLYPSRLLLHKAMWQKQLAGGVVQCQLCPYHCILKEGQRGQCGVRKNIGGVLYTLSYGRVTSYNIDPIEKKPVFHMLPGSFAYSLATGGCNLHCKFCQNWQISQRRPDEIDYVYMKPEDIVAAAKKSGCKSIAYTYSEPIIFYELMLETAKLAHAAGLYNIMVTAGFIEEKPLRQLCKYIDAATVGLKAFDQDYYSRIVGGRLDVVLRTLKIMKEEGVWVEVVNLVVPTLNDNMEEIRKMCLWIKDNLGPETPLHFLRFYPMYKLKNLPPTPVETLEKARQVALKAGLKFVYIGNVPGHPAENTYCPHCGKVLIERVGYGILANNLHQGRCRFCGRKIPGIWK